MEEITPEVRKALRQMGIVGGKKGVPHPDQSSDHALRGTPLVGGGRSSAIQGSHPERALLRKEQKGRLFLVAREPLPTPEELPPRTRKKLGRRVVAPGGRTW